MPDSLWKVDGGVHLGYQVDGLSDPPPDIKTATEFAYTGDTHLWTFGPSGTGKTRRLLITNLLRLKHWSMLVIDPKGQLAELTGDERAKYGDVFYLDPYNISGRGSNGFNPVASLDPEVNTFNDDVFGLSDAIIKSNPHANEPHWGNSAQDLAAGIITFSRLLAFYKLHGEKARPDDLKFLRGQLGMPPMGISDLAHSMVNLSNHIGHEELAVKAGRFLDFNSDNKELASIVSHALTETRWLASDAIKNDLVDVKRPLDFTQMRERPTTIYLILPANRLATQSQWLRLILQSAISKLMDKPNQAKVPILMVLEEMAHLGHLKVIEDNVGLVREYGIKLWGIFQSLNQIKGIYRENWEDFLGNAGVLSCFAPRDLTTSTYFSDLSGKTTVLRKSTSARPGAPGQESHQGSMTTSDHWVEQPLIYPQEVRQMDEGVMLSFSDQYRGRPILHHAPMYWDHPEYAPFKKFDAGAR